MSGWRFPVVLLAVAGAHAAVLAAALALDSSKPQRLELPTIQGVIIQAPPAEVVQAPSAREAQPVVEQPKPEPKPEVKPEPKPKPKPEPKPKPKPKPKPQPQSAPPVEAPPSERAITVESEAAPEPIAESAPPAAAAPSAAVPGAEDKDALGAPVELPRSDAAHLNNPAPAYPRLSRRAGEEGTVLLDVLILPDGTVGDIRIKVSSGYRRLDESALEAVRKWRFIPAKQGGKPIAYWYVQPVVFSLQQ